MAKNFVSLKTHLPKPHPKFDRVEVKNDEGVWSIDYRKDVRRYDLTKDGEIVYSHVSPQALSCVAFDRHGVDFYAPVEEVAVES